MINPTLYESKVLFVIEGCPFCRIAKKVCNEINPFVNFGKGIRIIDCTNKEKFNLSDNFLFQLFKKDIDGFPTLFYHGEKKEGANTEIEYKEWLTERLRLSGSLVEPDVIVN